MQAGEILNQLAILERQVLQLAEAMPESAYDSLPGQGNFADARAFGDQLRHLATVTFLTAATVWSERSPYPPGVNDNGPAREGKEQIICYVREAFAYSRSALSRLNESNERETIPTYFGPMRRRDLAWGIVAHSYNHYGQIAVLARLSGVVPAS